MLFVCIGIAFFQAFPRRQRVGSSGASSSTPAQHLGLKKFGVGLLVSWGHTGFASSCFKND